MRPKMQDEGSSDRSTEDKWETCRREPGSLVKINDQEKRQLRRPPRVFSDQFRAYVERELSCCGDASDDERFQVYRQVFQYIIEQFNEHRKILSDIKVEYDAAIGRRDDEIRHLLYDKREWDSERERYSRKLKAAQVTASRQVDEAAEAQGKLRHRLSVVLEEQAKLKDELMQAREGYLIEQKRYEEENRIRLEMETDLADLTQRYENLLRRVNTRPASDSRSITTAEDPVVLRVALNKCREELASVAAQLVVFESSYTEVVPKHDLQVAQAETERVRQQGQSRLAELQQVLLQERQTNAARTPRPDWAAAARFVAGGAAAWLPLRGSLPSSEVLYSLLRQLSASGPDTFTGLGAEREAVPIFLRYDGEVRNLRLTRQKVVNLICDIFECRDGNEDPFQEFVFIYFKERYPFTWADWTYSFHYALEQQTAESEHHLLRQQDVAELTPAATPGESADGPASPPPAHRPLPLEHTASRAQSGPERLSALLERRTTTAQGGAAPTGDAAGRAASVAPTPSTAHSAASAARAGSAGGLTPQPSAAAAAAGTAGEREEPAELAPSQRPLPEVPNSRIRLFWNILYQVQHESIYTRQRAALRQLHKEFVVADADKTGSVQYDAVGRIISETYFAVKTDEDVERLVLAAAFGNPEMDIAHLPQLESVPYNTFMDACHETDSPFLQEFYGQLQRAAADYASRLVQVLRDEEVIQPIVINQAITGLTSDALPSEVDLICRWLSRGTSGSVPLDLIIERLHGLSLPPLRHPTAEVDDS